MHNMTDKILPIPAPRPPRNGNPGIVPPWLQRNAPHMPAAGYYPTERPLTIDQVQRVLVHNGFVEVRPYGDTLPPRG